MKKTKIKDLFKKVRLLVLDVDGVLTRGEIIYDSQGRELKVFNVKDGLGVFLLGRAGIPTVILTAKDSPVVRRRAKDMRVAQVIGGVLPKESVLPGLVARYRVKADNICFIGDDLIDIGLLKKVGLPIAPADAPAPVKGAVRYVAGACGGQGAVREVVDRIIAAQKLLGKIEYFLKNPRR